MTAPHEELYAELQTWVLSKDGLYDARDVAEAVAQLFAAAVVSISPEQPVEKFRRMVPDLEQLIEEMWAQSAEEKSS